MDKETNQKSVILPELSVHMEEYRERSREILQRVEFQQRFLNYTLLSIGLALGLISSGGKNWNEVVPWTLLLFAFMFVCFSLWWSNEDMLIIWNATYINGELRPRIVNAIGGGQVLGWEDFLARERAKKGRRYLLIPGFGHEIPLIVALVLLVKVGHLVYADSSVIEPARVLLCLFWGVIPLWVLAFTIRILTNLRYLSVSPEQPS